MQGDRFNLLKLAPQFEEIHERMTGVVVENLPWRKFINRCDRLGMLFYLDLPYWRSEDDYGQEAYSRAEFAQMADVLGGIKGRFILSLNAVQVSMRAFRSSRLKKSTAHIQSQVAGIAKL